MRNNEGFRLDEVFGLFELGFEGYVENSIGQRFTVSEKGDILLNVKKNGEVVPVELTLATLTDTYYVEDSFEEVDIEDVTGLILQGKHLYFEYFHIKGDVLFSNRQVTIKFEEMTEPDNNSKYEIFVRALFNGTWKIKK